MSNWPQHPVVYETNTRGRHSAVGRKIQRGGDLSTVPPAQSDAIRKFALAAVSRMVAREEARAVLMSMALALIAGPDCGKRGQACQ